MFNFFAEENSRSGEYYYISGSDFNHIKNVLRMKIGESLLVSDNGDSHLCKVESFNGDTATVKIEQENYRSTELPIKIELYQGLPKGDKMELIIQKAVELGASKITAVEMHRSVVKLDGKKKKSKRERWQAIAESAAKQSKRNIVPEIGEVISYKQLMLQAKELDLFLIPYENKDGMSATKSALSLIKKDMRVGIIIGPEGGFEEAEVDEAIQAGGKVISLGARILRAETAAITATAMCMLQAEMSDEI